jgi:hypothetical protein
MTAAMLAETPTPTPTHRVWLLSVHTTASLVPDEEKQAAWTARLPHLGGRGAEVDMWICERRDVTTVLGVVTM